MKSCPSRPYLTPGGFPTLGAASTDATTGGTIRTSAPTTETAGTTGGTTGGTTEDTMTTTRTRGRDTANNDTDIIIDNHVSIKFVL